MEGVRQANRIIKQCIEKLPAGAVMADEPKVTLPPKDLVLKDMEHLTPPVHTYYKRPDRTGG